MDFIPSGWKSGTEDANQCFSLFMVHYQLFTPTGGGLPTHVFAILKGLNRSAQRLSRVREGLPWVTNQKTVNAESVASRRRGYDSVSTSPREPSEVQGKRGPKSFRHRRQFQTFVVRPATP
jgi:hypothetical protein